LFIAFEGIDGSGKSTQLNLLSQYLKSKGKKVLNIREPGGTILGEKIREILLDNNLNINKRSELLLFLASRAQLVEEVIKPHLKRGFFVLADRFSDSSIAYQGGARNIGVETVSTLNDFATDNIYPDIVFYIDIPTKIAMERLKDKNLDRLEKEGQIFLEKVRNTYLKLSKLRDNFFIIDGTKSIDNVFAEIKSIVEKHLQS